MNVPHFETEKLIELNEDGFYKYSSIENHYSTKYTNKIPAEIKDAPWVSSVKLDGANLSLYFQPNKPMLVGKRSGWIQQADEHHEAAENFYNVWTVLEKYTDILNYFQKLADGTGNTYRLFGELYGNGVQKRIMYGPEKYIKIFDVVINDIMLSPFDFDHFVDNANNDFVGDRIIFDNFFVEHTYHANLVEALSVDVEKPGIEGIVVKPYYDDVWLYGNERLIIKKKSSLFADAAKEKIGGKINNFDPAQMALSENFKRYITENRMLDLFSKHGEMQDIKQMGEYIKLFLEDAKADFIKENDISGLDAETQKAMFNIGSMAANMLRNHIKSTARI
jgi:Rnl2 family RNA ligase